MKRFALVVEGLTDKSFLQTLQPWFGELGLSVSITTAKDRSRLIRDAGKHLAVHRQGGADVVVFLFDQDEDECPPVSACLLSAVSGEGDVLVAVVARCLEAWFLADESAVSRATGRTYHCRGMTDFMPHPWNAIRGLFYQSRKQYLSKTEITRAISQHFDINAARQHNQSLARFASRVVQLARA
ncbi:MAG: DUF4276 family protein [Dehalococcoidia bacterium]